MAVQPLAAYTEDASVQKACQKVIRFAGKMQDTQGYLGDSYDANNAWTTAQTLTMLGEFGIHPMIETENVDFVKMVIHLRMPFWNLLIWIRKNCQPVL